MAQKFVELTSTTATDRMAKLYAGTSAIHLSDGTLVWLESDGTNYFLKYSSDHSTVNAIATMVNTDFATTIPALLLRDSSDNLFVLGNGATNNMKCKAFTKGAGYTWTPQTTVTTSFSWTAGLDVDATWCNTGGGTNSKGHIALAEVNNGGAGISLFYVLDAGVPLAGSGTLLVNTYANTACMKTTNTQGTDVSLSNDGFGVANGILAFIDVTGTTVRVGAWAVNSSGVLSTSNAIGTTAGNTGTQKCRAIRYASNAWAVCTGHSTNTTHVAVSRWSASANLTGITDSGTPTNWPLTANTDAWDALLDPITANKIWFITIGTLAGTNLPVWRLGCSLASGVTFDAAATADDTLSNVNTKQNSMRSVKEPTGSKVDWQSFQKIDASNFALDGDYTAFNNAPNAPTLTAPANASTQDLAAGYTFTWTFSDPDAGDTQAGYYFRRKVSGAGSYEYWNAGTSSWQGTEVFNSGASGSVTFGSGKWTTNTIYNWSVKTRDNNGGVDGPYASDNTVTASVAPVGTATAPSGTTASSQPSVTWTFSDSDGDAQQTYQVKVESGAYGSTPGSGTAVWDSTEITDSSARSVTTGVALTNGTTYRFFVRVKANGQYGSWTYVTATVQLNSPAQPTFTGTPDNANARAVIAVQGRDNLLTANQASIETDTTGLVAATNCSIARSTTVGGNDGAAALRLSSTASGTMTASTSTGLSGVAVTPNKTYTAIASFRTGVTTRTCRVGIAYYTAAGALIGSITYGGTITDPAGSWTKATATVAAPANAAFAAVFVEVQSTGGAAELHYVDTISIAPGSSTTWTLGGVAGVASMLVEYSDDNQVTWDTVRGADSAAVDSAANQQVTVYDYEKIITARYYRVTSRADV